MGVDQTKENVSIVGCDFYIKIGSFTLQQTDGY